MIPSWILALECGWQPVSLGDNRLRIETAAIVAAAAERLPLREMTLPVVSDAEPAGAAVTVTVLSPSPAGGAQLRMVFRDAGIFLRAKRKTSATEPD